MKPVMQYSDFREFLRDFYQERKPYGFSFREFSKLAGYSSPVFLKLVIEGKANLSERGTERVANATGLVGADVEYFRILVAMNQSKKAEEKKGYTLSFLPFSSVLKTLLFCTDLNNLIYFILTIPICQHLLNRLPP